MIDFTPLNCFTNEVKDFVENSGCENSLIHSDIFFGLPLKIKGKDNLLHAHCIEIENMFHSTNIFMPTFNYDFCKGLPYNINQDKSQVGTISEYYRLNFSNWRTMTPVFNFCGNNIKPKENFQNNIDPFDIDSTFGFLYEQNSLLVHYGSPFSTTTLIHFAERISNNLIYRYDKLFNGTIINESLEYNINLIYHVRPKNIIQDYDWNSLQMELITNKILKVFKYKGAVILICKISEIVDYWLTKINLDPFYLLDAKSKYIALEAFNKYNRKFVINDFE